MMNSTPIIARRRPLPQHQHASPTNSESLTFTESQFLLACERGDLGTVRFYLNSGTDLNVNCVDPLGRTALRIAIENENTEMIEVLLEHSVEVGDALLHAISEENVEAVELLLRHIDKETNALSQTHGVEINDRSSFTPDVTPIILAAHRDNYEIVKLLLDRGATIPQPHDVRCACSDCLQANMEDSLRLSRSRINAYRALASPSLICLSARDPILYAFEMSWELRRLSNIENEFKTEYQELSQKCQKFAVDILDQTRSSKELEIILNYDDSDLWPGRERAPGERMQLARLKLAILYRQKHFVAHANCQQLLASIWYEGLPGFRRRNIVFKVLLILVVCISFPFLSVMYLVSPKSVVGKFVRQPFVKFLCHSSSYCIFLFLLILASQRINYDWLFGDSSSSTSTSASAFNESDIGLLRQNTVDSFDRKERRGPAPTPVEWAITVWVFGLIWVEVKQLWSTGLHEYGRNMWNILDFITNCLYIATIALRAIAYVSVESEIASLPPHLQTIARYWPRREWHAWDPTLISECVFATANIFSSLKLVHIFTVNPHLGPLQISLGRMVIDIVKFFIVYCLVLFAFACGLNQLFWYYATMRSNECEKSKNPDQTASPEQIETWSRSCDARFFSFGNLYFALESLLWATFGLIDLDRLDVKEDHYVTEWVGETMFGAYSMIAIVVLLNMLIAMMANSFASIDNEADIEWKFARSKLWIEYFDESGTVPPPFNIVPAPKTIYAAMRYICEQLCHCARRQRAQRSLRLQKILKAVSQRETNYQAVVRNLVKRYVASVQRSKQQAEGVSEDDVNEIKQDINAFRYELLDILRQNGFQFEAAKRSMAFGGGKSKRRNAEAERRLRHTDSGRLVRLAATPSGPPSPSHSIPKASSLAPQTFQHSPPITESFLSVPGNGRKRSRPFLLERTAILNNLMRKRSAALRSEPPPPRDPTSPEEDTTIDETLDSQASNGNRFFVPHSSAIVHAPIPPCTVLDTAGVFHQEPTRQSFLWPDIEAADAESSDDIRDMDDDTVIL